MDGQWRMGRKRVWLRQQKRSSSLIVRSDGAWKSRKLSIIVSGVVFLVFTGVLTWALMAGASRQLLGGIIGVTFIAGMFGVIALVSPRAVTRLNRFGVHHVNTFPCKRRVRTRWSEVRRVRFGASRGGAMYSIEAPQGRVNVNLTMQKHEDVRAVVELFTKHLQARFCLKESSLRERAQREATSGVSHLKWAIVLAALGCVIVIATLPLATALAIVIPVAVLSILIIFFTAHARVSEDREQFAWRYPRSTHGTFLDWHEDTAR